MNFTGIGIIFSTLISIQCISQNSTPDTMPFSATSPSNPLHTSVQNKMHVNVMAGTQFWSVSGWGSGMSTHLMTGVTYPVSKRFIIGGGIGVLTNTMFGVHNLPGESFGTPNYTNGLVYVTGQYLLSQRITVTGTVYKEFNILNNSPQYRQFQNNTPQGAYMQVNYKINDYMQIEAGFGYSQGVSPYYNSFMGSPGYGGIFSDPYSPFGTFRR